MTHRNALRMLGGTALAALAPCAASVSHGSTPKSPHVHSDAMPPNLRDHKEHLLFAVPKKGRMHKTIVDMLKGSGFDYTRPERLDIAHCKASISSLAEAGSR